MPGGQLSQPMLLGPNKGLDSMLGAYAELQRQSEGTSIVAGMRPPLWLCQRGRVLIGGISTRSWCMTLLSKMYDTFIQIPLLSVISYLCKWRFQPSNTPFSLILRMFYWRLTISCSRAVCIRAPYAKFCDCRSSCFWQLPRSLSASCCSRFLVIKAGSWPAPSSAPIRAQFYIWKWAPSEIAVMDYSSFMNPANWKASRSPKK
jgi:hypothetical protein